jgi:hypothetical protein
MGFASLYPSYIPTALQTHLRDPAARFRPGSANHWPSENQRAQGTPGAGRTREPCVQKSVHFAHASNHRAAKQPAFPAQWCYGLYVVSPVSGLVSHRHEWIIHSLDPSVGRSGPHDFAVRVRRARLAQHPRPSHPRPTVRDDRPKRPSSSGRDVREGRCDLPDGASENICDRLARRANWTWPACDHTDVVYSAAAAAFAALASACSANSAINAARQRPAETTITRRPMGSMRRPKASGASAWQMRDGAPIRPSR